MSLELSDRSIEASIRHDILRPRCYHNDATLYHARIIITSSMAFGVVASAHLLNIIIAKIFSVRSRKTTTSCLCSWSSSVSPPITGFQSETFRNATAPDRLVQLCFFDLSPTSSAVATGTVLCCCNWNSSVLFLL